MSDTPSSPGEQAAGSGQLSEEVTPRCLATVSEKTAIEKRPQAYPLTADKALWMEILAVLALGWLPDLFVALASLQWPDLSAVATTNYSNLFLIVRAFQVSLPVLYIIWRSGEPWSHFGLAKPHWLLDCFPALAILVAVEFVHRLFWRIFPTIGTFPDLPPKVPTGPGGYALLIVGSCANGFSEELVMRGYLLFRFQQKTGSAVLAMIMTSLLFASYHLYYGPLGALDVLFTGLVFGGGFLLCRRLWPVAIAHLILDVVLMAQLWS